MRLSPRSIGILRRALLGVAIFVTLIALFVVEENWRGDRAWRAYQVEMKERGLWFELDTLQTPPVPDDRNFLKEPALAKIIFRNEDFAAREKILTEAGLTRPTRSGALQPDGPFDWRKVSAAFLKRNVPAQVRSEQAAADVLASMESARPLLDAARRAAAERPEVWLPLRTADDALRGISPSNALAVGQALNLRTNAELAIGQPADAFADLWAILRLAEAMEEWPTVMGVRVSSLLHRLSAATLRRGLIDHAWTDAQLQVIEGVWLASQPAAQLRRGLLGETIIQIAALESEQTARRQLDLPSWFFHGWFQQSKIRVCQLGDDLLAAIDVVNGKVSMEQFQRHDQDLEKIRRSFSPVRVLPRAIAVEASGQLSSFIEDSLWIDQAIVAAALERHFLARGTYPASLDELIPTYLPKMPAPLFDSRPMEYERTGADGYSLRSARWKATDPDLVWEMSSDNAARSAP
jgi:hypothetical protein